MRSVWLLALAASGCRGILGIEEARVFDAAPDVPALCAMWHPDGIEPCALGSPKPALELGPGVYTYSTTDAGGRLTDEAGNVRYESAVTAMQADQSQVAVMSVEALTIDAGAALRVEGKKPLVVISWSTIAVAGAIDAGSHLGVIDAAAHLAQTVRFGAGANAACSANVGKDGSNNLTQAGSGGGGGGGYQGTGGAGAPGVDALATGGAGGAPTTSTVLSGGCPGGASGAAGTRASAPANPSSQATGGAGGGALRLVAYDAITVTGAISANGAGGAGAPTKSACGGGGGGSGGQLMLDAGSVTISGVLAANGGGGGGGGDLGQTGRDGADGLAGIDPASGGATLGCGYQGGAGSALNQLRGGDGFQSAGAGTACGGGGGGGGAAGVIVIASAGYAALPTAKLSPPATLR